MENENLEEALIMIPRMLNSLSMRKSTKTSHLLFLAVNYFVWVVGKRYVLKKQYRETFEIIKAQERKRKGKTKGIKRN